MGRKYDERNVVAKLILIYVFYNPNCTAKEISVFLKNMGFGLGDNISSTYIGAVIRDYNFNKRCGWFNIIVDNEKDPFKYRIR